MASTAALSSRLFHNHRLTLPRLAQTPITTITYRSFASGKCLSSDLKSSQDDAKANTEGPKVASDGPKKPKKTQAELDEELRLKMQGIAGDGGEAGVELEDGQPVSMKRGVRDNMFRYI